MMLQESNWHYEIKANWPRLSAILILRLEILHLTLLKLFEQKKFLSNCNKQLLTPVNLTRNFFHKLFNFQDWELAPKAKKLPFIEVISAIVDLLMHENMKHLYLSCAECCYLVPSLPNSLKTRALSLHTG